MVLKCSVIENVPFSSWELEQVLPHEGVEERGKALVEEIALWTLRQMEMGGEHFTKVSCQCGEQGRGVWNTGTLFNVFSLFSVLPTCLYAVEITYLSCFPWTVSPLSFVNSMLISACSNRAQHWSVSTLERLLPAGGFRLPLSSCINSKEDEKVRNEAGAGFCSKQENRERISRKR